MSLNRTEKNRVLNYAKTALKKKAAVDKLFAKKEEMLKKYTEYYDKKIQESADYLEYNMNLTMVRTLLKDQNVEASDVIEEKVEKKEIMGNMCNTRTYKPTTAFLEKYCGITAEEAEAESAPSVAAEAAEEIAEEVESEAPDYTEESDDRESGESEIPEELNDDF